MHVLFGILTSPHQRPSFDDGMRGRARGMRGRARGRMVLRPDLQCVNTVGADLVLVAA